MSGHSPYQTLSDIYDAIRPSYPAALIQDILDYAHPGFNPPLLEIGAGTGKATEAFLARNYSIDAVELEASMAAHLSQKLDSPKLNLYVSPFETWAPPRTDYPLIYCAQAFHWLDKRIKFKKCRQILSSDGHLALFWYDPLPPRTSNADQAARHVKEKYFGPEAQTQAVSTASREQEIRETDCFSLVFRRQYDIVLHNTPEQALMAMQSTPAFAEKFGQLTPENQQQFLQEFTDAIVQHGGYLDAPLRYSLYILKPVHL